MENIALISLTADKRIYMSRPITQDIGVRLYYQLNEDILDKVAGFLSSSQSNILVIPQEFVNKSEVYKNFKKGKRDKNLIYYGDLPDPAHVARNKDFIKDLCRDIGIDGLLCLQFSYSDNSTALRCEMTVQLFDDSGNLVYQDSYMRHDDVNVIPLADLETIEAFHSKHLDFGKLIKFEPAPSILIAFFHPAAIYWLLNDSPFIKELNK